MAGGIVSDLTAEQTTAAPRPGSRIHPRFIELGSLLLIAPLCVVGAIIGVQLIVTLGITANTSLIGALAGMALSRIPLGAFSRYRSIYVQNLAQSAISAATFGAGNALMLPIGIPFVLGRPDLVPALFAGVFLAMLIDGYLLYRMFDSEVFPASVAWPPGAAAAEAIRAGDEGGRKAVILGVGVIVGIAGNWLIAPAVMSAFGVAFIGNIWALSMRKYVGRFGKSRGRMMPKMMTLKVASTSKTRSTSRMTILNHNAYGSMETLKTTAAIKSSPTQSAHLRFPIRPAIHVPANAAPAQAGTTRASIQCGHRFTCRHISSVVPLKSAGTG
jgi:hypothetical protein